MKVLFTMPECPHCEETNEAMVKANEKLSHKNHISKVDIWSGDSRTRFLEKYYGTSNRSKWLVPVFVLDKIIKERVFGIWLKRGKERIILHAGLPTDLLYKTLLNIFDVNKW